MLGSPLGHDAFVTRQLNSKREEQDRLLQRIPALDSLQAAWLLLLFCAAPRANYLLRILPPHLTADYAVAHDVAVARCLAALLEHGNAPLPVSGTTCVDVASPKTPCPHIPVLQHIMPWIVPLGIWWCTNNLTQMFAEMNVNSM